MKGGAAMSQRYVVLLAVCAGLIGAHGVALGQELEARAFSPAPVGTTFVIAGAGKSDGAIVFDGSLDIDNVRADLDVVTVGFGRVFAWGERQARVLAVLPFATGAIAGDVGSVPQEARLHGAVDPRLKISLALRGAPALTLEEFAHAPRKTVVGASLTVVPPWGAYDGDRLVNLGYNRWAVKPEIGIAHPLGPWTLEGSVGAWLYGRNAQFFPGAAHRRQEPLWSAQLHVGYAWASRLWLALDATRFSGGETRVDGVRNPDEQANSRAGLTLSVPFGRRNSLKLTYSEGATTRRGSDFGSFMATWQFVKF